MKFLERLAIRLRHILSIPVNSAIALITGLYTLLWGLWVASPFWEVFDTASLFHALNTAMPEVGWGLVAIATGAFMVWGVTKHSWKSLNWGSFVGFIHWLVISGGYFIGDWQNTGGIRALVLAIYCGYIYLNLRVSRDNDDSQL
jgi:hypothetical protein